MAFDDQNSTGNATVDPYEFFKTEQITLLSFLFIVIVAGNCGVLCTLLFCRSRKSRMNFFITQLAIADLLMGGVNVLTDIIWKLTIGWYAGNIACKLIRYMQAVITYASTYVLVALSIDRYDAIRHPMNFRGSWKRAKFLIIAAWLCSALFSTPLLFFFEESQINEKPQCWIDLEPQTFKIYMTLNSIAIFIIPALIITFCYAIIILTIWAKNAEGFVRNTNDGSTGSDSRRASSRGLIPRAKVKTIKITFVIVSVFILCWSPYIVFDLLQVYGYIPPTQSNIAIATLINSLYVLNSAANPIIYFIFSTHFCRTLGSLPLLKKGTRHAGETTGNTHSSTLSEFLTNTQKRKSESCATANTPHALLIHETKNIQRATPK